MTHVDLSTVVRTYEALGYRYFTDKYDLNIGAIRSADLESGKFNDIFFTFHRVDGLWNFYAGDCTTDPGLYYRDNPITPAGTAIMLPGQNRGAYVIGKHKSRYPALRQNKPINFARVMSDQWHDQNLLENLYGVVTSADGSSRGFNIERKVIGANIHRALEFVTIADVGKFSAACIVQPDPDQHRRFMALCRQQVREGKGNSFTFTLLAENQLVK
jgi:hypothetical protein